MLKLTRLNRSLVAVNPDHILWVEASPDTTLCLVNGDKLIVRESVDEVLEEYVELKRRIHGDPVFEWPPSNRFVGSTSSLPPIPSMRSLPPIPSLRSIESATSHLATLHPITARSTSQGASFAILNEESSS